LQQLFASALVHVFAQPDDLASLVEADVFAAELEQQAFAGASLLVLTFSVLALSADVTFCADAVFTVKAKIKANNEITSATFFIVIDY
jgi:hypothetical protein